MILKIWEHDGDHYCMLSTYVMGDAARYFELSEARALTAKQDPAHNDFVPGSAAVTVVVHDPEVEKPPYTFFDTDQEVPFEVLKYFIELVSEALDKDPHPQAADSD